MCETMTIDTRTIIIKADDESELSEVIELITGRNKEKTLKSFLDFAAQNRIVDSKFKFNREECYDR